MHYTSCSTQQCCINTVCLLENREKCNFKCLLSMRYLDDLMKTIK